MERGDQSARIDLAARKNTVIHAAASAQTAACSPTPNVPRVPPIGDTDCPRGGTQVGRGRRHLAPRPVRAPSTWARLGCKTNTEPSRDLVSDARYRSALVYAFDQIQLTASMSNVASRGHGAKRASPRVISSQASRTSTALPQYDARVNEAVTHAPPGRGTSSKPLAANVFRAGAFESVDEPRLVPCPRTFANLLGGRIPSQPTVPPSRPAPRQDLRRLVASPSGSCTQPRARRRHRSGVRAVRVVSAKATRLGMRSKSGPNTSQLSAVLRPAGSRHPFSRSSSRGRSSALALFTPRGP
jgi:hypothetical protein